VARDSALSDVDRNILGVVRELVTASEPAGDR
jgi:hypothetical protein